MSELPSSWKPVLPQGAQIKCKGCGETRAYRLYSRRLDQAVCQRCYDAGVRLTDKEG